MKKFTVILLYPDYAAQEFGHETWMGVVDARSPKPALRKARAECKGLNPDIDSPNDLFCIAVIAGEHTDLNPES